jgi:hypothetical protein
MLRAGAVGVGAASRYGSGSTKMMQLFAAAALQHCLCEKRIRGLAQTSLAVKSSIFSISVETRAQFF